MSGAISTRSLLWSFADLPPPLGDRIQAQTRSVPGKNPVIYPPGAPVFKCLCGPNTLQNRAGGGGRKRDLKNRDRGRNTNSQPNKQQQQTNKNLIVPVLWDSQLCRNFEKTLCFKFWEYAGSNITQ